MERGFCLTTFRGAALDSGRNQTVLVVCALAVAGAFAWSYAPTMRSLWETWQSEPDYSHGIFVVPVAIAFLWFRRGERPDLAPRLSPIPGAALVFAAALRFLGNRWNFEALDHWSLIAWATGAAWLAGGWPMFRWCLPSIGFLFFMMPLPFRIEQSLSLPLQTIATQASCWTLQSLGQCALAEGHTILMDGQRLEIEQACSGLRIVFGTLAMSVAYAILTQRDWRERMLIVACALPVALAANVFRIVVTGFVKENYPGSPLADWSHSAGGHLMTGVAVALFAMISWYLGRLFPRLEDAADDQTAEVEPPLHRWAPLVPRT